MWRLKKGSTWVKSCRKNPEIADLFFAGGDCKGGLKRVPCNLFRSEATCIIRFYYGVDHVKNKY